MSNRTRDLEIYRGLVNGKPVGVLATEHGLSVARVYSITARIRNEMQMSAPMGALRDDLTEQLNEMRAISAGLARSHLVADSDRVSAVKATVAVANRLAAMHGLDAASKTETTGTVTYVIEGVSPDDV